MLLDSWSVTLPNPIGTILLLVAIGVSVIVWTQLARKDSRLPMVYLLGLLGGFLGAKVGFIFAEFTIWHGTPLFWPQMLAGKTILGALLVGYAFVELAKRQVGYREATGDLFAITAPLGIFIGRIGCLTAGCCLGQVYPSAWYALPDHQGVPRWPAVPLEMGFNLLMLLIFLTFRKFNVLRGQHFHIYLMAYGVFRLTHEIMRDTPRLFGPLSGYQFLAIALFLLGAWGYRKRAITTGNQISMS
jgi:phosphatidylglycerol:prolipoprotein diacylglycerol transferase